MFENVHNYHLKYYEMAIWFCTFKVPFQEGNYHKSSKEVKVPGFDSAATLYVAGNPVLF